MANHICHFEFMCNDVAKAKEFYGKVFDWANVMKDVMRIRAAKLSPRNAAVKAKCRGNWFYIADDDTASKATFYLLTQLYLLQSGGLTTASIPVLTM